MFYSSAGNIILYGSVGIALWETGEVMGRKTQITKDMMIEAAYDILKTEGYPAVNINTIANKVGCSTQPISWQFGNMQGLRKELYYYTAHKMFGQLISGTEELNAVEKFLETAKRYVSFVNREPNVFRFICVDDPGDIVAVTSNVTDLMGDDRIRSILAEELNIPLDVSAKVVTDIVLYTQGLAVTMLWDSVHIDDEQAHSMVVDQARRCFGQYGIKTDI